MLSLSCCKLKRLFAWFHLNQRANSAETGLLPRIKRLCEARRGPPGANGCWRPAIMLCQLGCDGETHIRRTCRNDVNLRPARPAGPAQLRAAGALPQWSARAPLASAQLSARRTSGIGQVQVAAGWACGARTRFVPEQK